MITAHVPSGYLLGQSLCGAPATRGHAVLAAALFGAVFPDLDLIWFYLIDDCAIHHHRYWVHAPAFAMACSFVLLLAVRQLAPRWSPAALAFSAAWLLHILLDTLTGGIMWLWPVSDTLITLITVPANYGHFVLSFLLHWSILFELAIWCAALVLWRRQRQVG